MTLKNDPELLIRILDTYTSGVTNSLETVAAMNGVSFRSVYSWLRDESITVDYMGEQNITFGRAMNLARNVSKVLTVGRSLEDRVLNGLKVQVWHHGQPSYVDDEKAILIEDLDLRELIFGYRDGKKRDADGNRIIATRIEAPPAQLVEVYARANMPSIYGHKTETTIRGNLELGVQVVGSRGPVPPEALPYATAADLAGTITETTLIESAKGEVFEAVAADEVLDELLGLEVTDTSPDAPEPDEPEPAAVRTAEPDPGASSSAPTEREISAPANPMLNIAPGWRSEYQALLDRNATDGANARRRMVR